MEENHVTKRNLLHFKLLRFVFALIISGLLLLFCGLTAFAIELFPTDIQTVAVDGTRQIVKTYTLTADQNPADIPRNDFERDGWRYVFTDITEKRADNEIDKKNHAETVIINTDSKDLNVILTQLAPTMDYASNDGYCGILSLDISSVKCEIAGYKNSSYTVTTTREYPNLSNNDLSFIPKSITDNGQILQLDDVKWEIQGYVTVDYDEIPDVYRAVAKYTGTATKSVVTGYVTTAKYSGEITKNIKGNTIYTVYFSGTEIILEPDTNIDISTESTETLETTDSEEIHDISSISTTEYMLMQDISQFPIAQILVVTLILTAIFGALMFFLKRRNVKIYRDNFSVLAAKDRIDAKNLMIDLSPLEGKSFGIEIDKFTAKMLNGTVIEIKQNTVSLSHKIAYEGNVYRIKADFDTSTIQAIY